MKHKLVFIRFFTLLILLLFTVPLSDCQAQRNATRRVEKELFGKSRKSKPFEEGKARGAAAKAMKEQEKKEAARDREDEKQLKELRKQHYEKQSPETRVRMENNTRNTEAKYKVKRQKQRKEQTKPELQKPEQPRPEKVKAKPKTRDPNKVPQLKQQKSKAKSKLKDPKKQPRLKQHKIKKY